MLSSSPDVNSRGSPDFSFRDLSEHHHRLPGNSFSQEDFVIDRVNAEGCKGMKRDLNLASRGRDKENTRRKSFLFMKLDFRIYNYLKI